MTLTARVISLVIPPASIADEKADGDSYHVPLSTLIYPALSHLAKHAKEHEVASLP